MRIDITPEETARVAHHIACELRELSDDTWRIEHKQQLCKRADELEKTVETNQERT